MWHIEGFGEFWVEGQTVIMAGRVGEGFVEVTFGLDLERG